MISSLIRDRNVLILTFILALLSLTVIACWYLDPTALDIAKLNINTLQDILVLCGIVVLSMGMLYLFLRETAAIVNDKRT